MKKELEDKIGVGLVLAGILGTFQNSFKTHKM